MSKRKTTKSEKKTSTTTKKFVKSRGIGLAVKLYRMDGMEHSATKVASLLKEHPYDPKKKDSIEAGFSSVKTRGKVVSAEFVAGFRVQVLTYDADGNLTPVHYVSVDRGEALIKLDKNTIEVRGSERIARKFLRLLEEATGAKASVMNLNGGTKKLYDTASEINSVLFSGIEKGNLSQVEFKGSGIQTEEEIGLYTRRYKGEITRFRGSFPYPSGAFLTTTVNTETGSFVVYKSGDGILEKDLDWIVNLMEDAALEQ